MTSPDEIIRIHLIQPEIIDLKPVGADSDHDIAAHLSRRRADIGETAEPRKGGKVDLVIAIVEIGDPVATRIEHKDIGTAAPDQQVISGPAIQRIIAFMTIQSVGALHPGDPVIALASAHKVIAGAGIDAVIAFAAENAVATGAGGHPVITAAGMDQVMAAARSDDIVAFPGPDRVIAAPRSDPIISAAGKDQIGPAADLNDIVTLASIDGVISGAGVNAVIAAEIADQIVTGPGKDQIVAATAIKRIGAIAAIEGVIARHPEYLIGKGAAQQQIVAIISTDNSHIVISFSLHLGGWGSWPAHLRRDKAGRFQPARNRAGAGRMEFPVPLACPEGLSAGAPGTGLARRAVPRR